MAILIEQQERKTNWFAIFVFLFLLAVIAGGGYFLFFSPTPAIDIIIPSSLDTAEALSEVQINPSAIINNPVLKGLRQYGSSPSIGTVGRQNPFISF